MTPILSVIIAVYNVEEYVPATLRSIDRQDVRDGLVEYVFVDDGSTDRSHEIIARWAKSKTNVRVLRQDNQGAGAARKAALKVVNGCWVTVVDPDDIIDRSYFSAILDFIDRDVDQVADMLVTKVLVLNGGTGRAYDSHPLGYRFRGGSRLVSLREEPSCIQLGATAVLRVSRLREHRLTYDPRIEPTFEDAHLLGRYLSKSADPVIGIVANAKYYYRKRTDQSSLVQSSWSLESRYSTVLELGYLDMLLSIRDELGYVPVWAQNMVLYDLIWYFKEESKQHSKTAWISGDLREQFLGLLMRIFDLIDTSTIEKFSINPVWWSMRQALLGFFKRSYSLGNRVVQWGPDKKDGSNQYCILSFGDEPLIQIYADGKSVVPKSDNYTVHSYFGIPMMIERNITVGAPGHVGIFVDGRRALVERAVTKVDLPKPMPGSIRLKEGLSSDSRVFRKIAGFGGGRASMDSLAEALDSMSRKKKYLKTRLEVESLALDQNPAKVLLRTSKSVLARYSTKSSEKKLRNRATELIAESKGGLVRSKYHNAWVIMDRPLRADDNGEHLYRYINMNRKDINAFFLLKRESPDWERLHSEGFRLVEYGSDESVRLLLNAEFRMSSDAVADVMYPINRKYYDLSGSKFIFLQHGVTKDDISRWLNPKKLDGIVCATVDEYESIVGPNSPYTIKRNQALLTGFPRFDRLHELVTNRQAEPDLILVMPTWRQYLRDELELCPDSRSKSSVFNESDFGRNWLSFLRSKELNDIALRHNMRIAFIAHPAFSSLIDYLELPDHVEVLDPSVIGFQNILVRSAVFVTDYSSVAFDAANIKVPVVYFQFDPETMFGGGHNFRRGYYDYERDGFGPVCSDPADVIRGVSAALDPSNSGGSSIYYRRMERAFPYTDANNSARVVESLFELK